MKKEAGKYYHIFNRGNNKQKIFFEDENFSFFLDRFKKYVIPHVDVFSYCLMPNHFHFFLRINDLENFEKSIKNFFISYSKAINKKYNRVGGLFQGRYKISEIDSNAYFTKIIIYIHHNPIIANLVSRLEDYKFSSYIAYLNPNQKSVVKREEVIEWFGDLNNFIKCHQHNEDYDVRKLIV